MIELAPPHIAADMPRLRSRLTRPEGRMTLVGRRDLRSNNSWMHNIEPLVRGRPRCTLWVHPDDAERLGLADGTPASVRSRAGRVEVPVEVTDAIMPGVVSVPHGWGHDAPGIALRVASANAGVNSNLLADELAMDPLSGNAVLNGIPVTVEPRLRLGSNGISESSACGDQGEAPCRGRRSRRGNNSTPRPQPSVPDVCRAGFAGRGTTPARPTTPHARPPPRPETKSRVEVILVERG